MVKQSFLALLIQPLAVKLIDIPPCQYHAQYMLYEFTQYTARDLKYGWIKRGICYVNILN